MTHFTRTEIQDIRKARGAVIIGILLMIAGLLWVLPVPLWLVGSLAWGWIPYVFLLARVFGTGMFLLIIMDIIVAMYHIPNIE